MLDAIETFDAFADRYEESRRLMIEPYDEVYGTLVDALRLAQRPPERILDLGAGTGAVARAVRAAYPEAEIVLIDGSQAMLERARGTVTGNADYIVADLRDGLPGGRFDAVVSAMAIHHLPHADQRDLYRRVFAVLGSGGVFVNAEIVTGPGPLTSDAYQRWHERSVRSRGGHDHDWHSYLHRQSADICASLGDQLRWLEEAGFGEPDCLYKQRLFAVLVGIKGS